MVDSVKNNTPPKTNPWESTTFGSINFPGAFENPKKSGQIIATSHDLTPNGGDCKGNPLISGKPRLVKYYIIWPAKNPWFEKWWKKQFPETCKLGSETSETGFLFWRVLCLMGFPRLWQFVEIPKCMKKIPQGKNINLNALGFFVCLVFQYGNKTQWYFKCPVRSKWTHPRTTNGPQGSDDLGREFRNCLDQWSWGNSEGMEPWFEWFGLRGPP